MTPEIAEALKSVENEGSFMSSVCARNRTCRLCEVNRRSDPLLVDPQGDPLDPPKPRRKSNEEGNVTWR